MIDQLTPEVLAQLLQQQQSQQAKAENPHSFVSKAKRGCTLLEKLSGTWSIKAVSPSNGSDRGVNPILAIEQDGVKKRCYTHPSNLPNCQESNETFTWGIPKLTDASTVTIKDGDAVFNW